jgi:tripartite-type tricarboxylate transporter receptor subunit TctC
MNEAGFAGFDETAPWVGMFAPAKTPEPIVQKIYEAMRQSLAKPATVERMKSLGGVIVGNSPAEFTKYLKADSDRWARVIKAARIKAE